MADLYTDHNVALQIAVLLRAAGHDVVTARERNLERAGDDEQLLAAAEVGRLLITHNAKDFILLHDAWRRWSKAWNLAAHHAGILVIPQLPPARAAQEIDDFLRSRPRLQDELYLWRAASGWVGRP